MREFLDEQGRTWSATVGRDDGGDYKGQFYLVMECPDAGEGVVSLDDVRWNSERTADRTLRTMSDTELRRRLRSARGRAGTRLGV